MVKRTANDVIFEENASRPVLVHFENGEVHSDKLKDFACSLYQNEQGSFVPVLATDKMIYSNSISRDNPDELYYNILAVKNKTTKKIRYVVLDTVDLKATPVVKKDFELNSTLSRDATMSELNKTFGSKRTQRQTEQSERLKMNVDNMREDLEKTVANIEGDFTGPEEITQKLDLYLPPKDELATKPEDVYKIKEIIPKKVLKSLNEIAETIINDDSNEQISTDYVKKALNKIRESGTAKIETVRLLLVLDCLIAMSMATLRAITIKSYKPCLYSELLSDYLLETFTTPNEKNSTRLRSASMKQKAISYVLLFALLCNNYEVDLEEISITMKMSVRKLQDTCRALLFTPNKQKKKVFDLVLPLPKAPQLHGVNKAAKKFK